ncbi:alpha/beta hydrolase [Pelagibius litoralis]|uniref:Alpha/beta hydrolase n=1 Tax=Pelagibius litoralis TaxID=374515 RepID=A0A967F016_9PROT|nr:alpha/beta hydrolase [Pelagibius litoralis]NIA70532.1 alpha/beta hydrolase [Pelagibius litoralis]
MELTVEGARVYTATGGRSFDPDLPAVVFLHGAGLDHTVWALPARYFAHHDASVLAVDLPGHGRSGGAALTSIEAIADWTVKLLDEAGLAKATLVGHSMGALAALDCAARHTGRVRAAALMGVAPKMPVHPDLLAAAETNDPVAFALMTSWGFGPSGHFGGARMPGAWMMGGGEQLLAQVPPGVLYRDLSACNAYQGAMAAAEKITCPLLVVMGDQDKMTPARAGAKLAAAIPGARQVTIPACGHMMLSEKPDESLDALRTIL